MIGKVWLAVKEAAGMAIGLPIGLALGVYYRAVMAWEKRRK